MSTAREEEAELHIFKRHMGLTKRGSHGNGGLTVSEVLVQQTDNFTVHDTSHFVTLVIPTAQILQTKVRNEGNDLRVCVMCAGHICFFFCKNEAPFLFFLTKIHCKLQNLDLSLFHSPAQKSTSSCSRSTGSMLCSPSRRQITKCTGAWRTRYHAQVSATLINT